MATDPFQLYPVIAQIAGAFAGFGSLASGLGQRRGGDDARVDASRLTTMLFASLAATLLGLLPATLANISGEQAALRWSALIAVSAMLIYAPVGASRSMSIRGAVGFSIVATIANFICSLLAFAAFALCGAGVYPARAADFYLIGLMGMLASSVVMFSRVIVSMLRPHRAADV